MVESKLFILYQIAQMLVLGCDCWVEKHYYIKKLEPWVLADSMAIAANGVKPIYHLELIKLVLYY